MVPNLSFTDIVSSLDTEDGYTAPSNGFVTVEAPAGRASVQLVINKTIVAKGYNYNGDSHGQQQTFLFAPIGKGQKVQFQRDGAHWMASFGRFFSYSA